MKVGYRSPWLAVAVWAAGTSALAQQLPSQPGKFTTSLTGAQEFDSLEQAETTMRAASPEASDLERRPSGDRQANSFYLRQYGKPDIRPEPELPWQLFGACLGDGEFNAIEECTNVEHATEQAAIDLVVLSGGCQLGLPTEIVDTVWFDWETATGPVKPFAERGLRNYRFTGPGLPEDGRPCIHLGVTHVHAFAFREYVCPAGYNKAIASDAQIYCWHDLVATISEFADFDDIECEEALGNPCNPATGGKTQTVVDYEAPGIRFVRTWRSKVAPRYAYSGAWAAQEESLALNGVPVPTAVLPWGWTHSYAMKVEPRPGGIEAFRPDGATVFLAGSGSSFVAADASGVQARQSGSDITIYLPDGSRELYARYFCTGGVSVYRLEQVVDPSGRVTQVLYSVSGCQNGAPTSVVGPFGHVLEIDYNGEPGAVDAHIDRLVDSGGQTIDFVYAIKSVDELSDVVLDRVVYQDGNFQRYLYEDDRPANRRLLTGLVDETGVEYAAFAYDDAGRATSTERAGGFFRWDFAYNPDGTHTATDANDVVNTYEFQSLDRAGVIGEVSRAGTPRSKTSETTGQHRALSSTDERGVTTTYTYDLFHLASTTAAAGTAEARTTSFQYLNETSSLLTSETAPSTCGAGFTRNTAYLSGTQLVQQRSETGYSNQSGSCQQITRAITFEYGASGSFTRNNGLVTAIRGPRVGVADDVTFTYHECATGDACGQIATMTNAAGHVWTFDSYNDQGQVTQTTQPNGVVVTFGYDPRQRLRTITETASGLPTRTTTTDYFDNGLVERVTDPTGAFVEYTYNDARLLTEIRDNTGNRIEYGHDVAGNRTSETIRNPGGTITSSRTMDYDDFNQLDTVSLPNPAGGSDVWNYDFDATGLLESVTSPEGRTTTYDDYDALGRLRSFANALDQRTTYAYDVLDNLISVTALTTPSYPAGVVTSYFYDDFGRQVRETSADRGVLTHSFDEADNLLLTVDARGLSTDYVYDVLNRLTTIQVEPQGGGVQETQSITYDDTTPDGRRGQIVATSAQNGSLAYAYGYDALGRRTSEQLSYTGLSTAVLTQYTFDAADRIEEIRRGTPAQSDLWVTRHVRDATGLTTDVEDRRATPVDIVGSVQHAAFGPYLAMTFGNAQQVSRSLDQRYRLSSSVIPNGETRTLAWTRDDNLDVEDVLVTFTGSDQSGTHRYESTYDELNRLVDIYFPYQTEYAQRTYAFDLNGQHGDLAQNTLVYNGQTLHSTTHSYTPATHRLAQIQNNVNAKLQFFNFDASGNMTSTSGQTAAIGFPASEYDSAGQSRVIRTTPTSSVRARYDFNPFGERARKETYAFYGQPAATTLFTYLPDGKLLGEAIFTNNQLAEQRDYVWMDDTPVAMHVSKLDSSGTITDDQTYYLHADHLNAPVEATDASGQLVWQFKDAISGYGFGYVATFSGGPISPINLRFPGQYFDAETFSLNYNYYRNYAPSLGRYVQPDPVGLEGGLNPYLYVEGNPLAFVDPLGLNKQGGRPTIAPLSQGVSEAMASYQVPALIQQIQSIRPGFQYVNVRPPRAPWNRQDVEALRLEFGRALENICEAPASAMPFGISPAPGTRIRPLGVPGSWRIQSSESPGGVQFFDPMNPGNQVRIEQGNPRSPYPTSQTPYIRDLRNGQYRDAQGNVVPRTDPAGHIPLHQYPGYRR